MSDSQELVIVNPNGDVVWQPSQAAIRTDGIQGVGGAAGTFLSSWDGEWNPATAYPTGRIVKLTFDSGAVSIYLSIAPSTGSSPDVSPSYWTLIGAGSKGDTGAQGTGTSGAVEVDFSAFKRTWATSTSYAIGDTVRRKGTFAVPAVWVSRKNHTSNPGNAPDIDHDPDDTNATWALLTQDGADGAAGAQGKPSTVAGPPGADGADGTNGADGTSASTYILVQVADGDDSWFSTIPDAITITAESVTKDDSRSEITGATWTYYYDDGTENELGTQADMPFVVPALSDLVIKRGANVGYRQFTVSAHLHED
jgi:hypothetical protein